VAFYVPLGTRGILFRVGTALIGFLGGWVYWRASRRRGLVAVPLPLLAFDLPETELLP
jgi:hypothetical protein